MPSHTNYIWVGVHSRVTVAPAVAMAWAAALLFFSSIPVSADPVGYTMTGLELTRLDLGTGSFSTVGPIGVNKVAGASAGIDGFIYAVGELSDELWQIDPNTGASTLIGGTGIDVGAETGLAIDACGTFWMVTNRRLYRMDSNTGAATLVSNLGQRIFALAAYGENLFGLVITDADSQLARIDPKTGTVSPFGDLILLPTQRKGLAFDADGRLWGLFWIEGFIPVPWISSIVEYAPVSGAILSVREIPDAQLAVALGGNLAIASPQGLCGSAATDIPALSIGGFIVLGILLAGAAVLFLRG